MKKVGPELHERLTTLISSMGYELVGCELGSQGRQRVFRIYIDSVKGITPDDCSLVSHQVSAMMDVLEAVQGSYILEVSSPGINRPLFELEHYRKHIGSRVRIRLYTPINEQRQYKGTLQRIEGEDICLLLDGSEQEVILPFSAIEKANVIGDIQF